MKIPAQGMSRDEVMDKLQGFRSGDTSMRDGRALAYVFHASEEAAAVAERAYLMYVWENALDPTVFPSGLSFETQVVAMASAHLRGDDEVVGNFTSGGTESVLLAVKTARDYARARKPDLKRPNMVLPNTAHPCFFKAAHYFEVEPISVPVDPKTCKADVAAMAAAINDDTVLLVGSATSYAHGVVDPIPELGQLALEKNLLLHVDGCIGGFLLPYFRELGAEVTEFDFTVPGVTSISMDLHKYAYAPKGASVIMYKNDTIRRHQIFSYSAWPGYSLVNATIQSSKSVGPIAAAWATLHFTGNDGYTQIAEELLAARKVVIDGIAAIDDLYVVGDPEMTLFAFGSKTVNLFRLCDEMKRRGWLMHPQLKLGELEATIHINLIPNNGGQLDAWLAELSSAIEHVKTTDSDGSMAQLKQALDSIDLTKLDDKGIEMLLEFAGLGGGGLPGGELGELWEVLNEIDSDVKDHVLTVYWNKLNRYRG